MSSLDGFQNEDRRGGFLSQGDGVSVHQFSAGVDGFAAIEVLDLVTLLGINAGLESGTAPSSMPLIVATAKCGVERLLIVGSSPLVAQDCQGLLPTNPKNSFGNSEHRTDVGDCGF